MSNFTLTIASTTIRQVDGLYSLNDLHKASGGKTRNKPVLFLRLEQTKSLIDEISKGTDLYLSTKIGAQGGTYACKELVIAYAAWISAEFHLKVIRVFLSSELQEQPVLDFDITNKNTLSEARKAAVKYLDDFQAAIKAGKKSPFMDEIPQEVLIGLLASSLWRNQFILSFNHDGAMSIRPMLDPYEGLAKEIADQSNIGLEDSTIEEIGQACMTALAHRAKRRQELISGLRKR